MRAMSYIQKRRKRKIRYFQSLNVYSQRPGGGISAASFSFCVEITGSSVTQGAACSSSLLKSAPEPSLQFCYLPLLGGTSSSLDLKPKCADDMMYVDFSVCG